MSAGQAHTAIGSLESLPPGPLVACEAASRTFVRGDVEVTAVHAVNCSVTAGMRVALTGRSGSGKSTLLHLLAGLDVPSAGTVRWPGLGGSPRGRPTVVGVVFQGPSLVPALDLVENVALPLLLADLDEATALERARVALVRLDLESLAGKLPEEISGGQAQRVAIARTLASRPSMILADEPTGQVDRDTADHVLSVLVEVADELGAALVVATHDERVAGRLTDRWRMTDGRLTLGQPA